MTLARLKAVPNNQPVCDLEDGRHIHYPHDILYSHALKRVDDTDGGSKQADERSNGTDRREPAQPSFQVFD